LGQNEEKEKDLDRGGGGGWLRERGGVIEQPQNHDSDSKKFCTEGFEKDRGRNKIWGLHSAISGRRKRD